MLPWCTRYSSASFPASKKTESVPMTALVLEVQNVLIPFVWMDTMSVCTTHLDGGQVGELRQWWDKGIALGVHVKAGCNPCMIARYHKGVRSSEALASHLWHRKNVMHESKKMSKIGAVCSAWSLLCKARCSVESPSIWNMQSDCCKDKWRMTFCKTCWLTQRSISLQYLNLPPPTLP